MLVCDGNARKVNDDDDNDDVDSGRMGGCANL